MNACYRLPILLILLLAVLSGCSLTAHRPVPIAHLDKGWLYRTGLGWAPDGSSVIVMAEPEPTPGRAASGLGYVKSVTSTGRGGGDFDSCRSAVVPRYTPDGQRVLLLATDLAGNLVLRPEGERQGSSVYAPSDGYQISGAALAQDGHHLAIVERGCGSRTAAPQPYRVRLSPDRGRTARDVWTSSLPPVAVRWSPDGRHLLLAAMDESREGVNAILVDATTGKAAAIAAGPGLWGPTEQAWAPDSTRFVAATTDESGTRTTFWVSNTRTGDVTEIAELDGGGDPAWSPRGDTIAAYVAALDSHAMWHSALYLLYPEGGEPRRILPWSEGEVRGISWSPLGDRLAIIRDNEIYVLKIEGRP